ncbi:MAG: hypothetical protein JWR09_2590 [Mucilaginibacter sp.]|nr:hypothetical protein [Mucilaginibacter sp.]
MKKLTLSVILLFSIMFQCLGQGQPATILPDPKPYTPVQLDKALKDIADKDIAFLNDPCNCHFASAYTFNNLIKTDFSTLTIADNSATVGQFASLTIDPNTYKLAFSPYAWSDDFSSKKKDNVYAFNITGVLSNQSLLNLKDWRTLVGNFTYTRIVGEGYRKLDTKDAKISLDNYQSIYDELRKNMKDSYDNVYQNKSEMTFLNHPEFGKLTDAEKAYQDSIAKYEQILTKSIWSSKNFFWYKVTVNFASFDNANYILQKDPTTYDSPKTSIEYTGSLNLAANYFIGTSNHMNYYLSANAQIGRKDMFAGIYTPATYNGFSKLTDTSLIQKTNEQIFKVPGDLVKPKWLPDFGAEVIIMKTINKVGLGLDLNYTYSIVISDKAGFSTGYISSPSIGIVVGLQDKTGKSNINIEPFFQFQDYIRVTEPSQHLYGLKFSIPINTLY